MKHLVTCLVGDDVELPTRIASDLNEAINYVKNNTFLYTNRVFRIYSLSKPLTVRYLDNKIFID